MNKITLLSFFLFSVSFTFGQILISQDFETDLTLPTGWTNNEVTSTGNIWTFETGGFAPFLGDFNTSFYTEGGFSGNYAILNSDAYGGGPEETALESPAFDCSGLTNIKLTFNHLFVSGFGGEAYVEVYNGASWVEIMSYTEATITANTFISGSIILDVTAELKDITNAQVRFRWVGDFSYYWGIDNITVQQPTIPIPNPAITPNPIDSATDVALALDTDYNEDLVIDASDAAYTFSWENALTGEAPDGYIFYFGTSNPPTALADISNTSFTLFGLEYSTTYYWAAVSYNITGGATGTSVWSFTTGSNPALSIDNNQLKITNAYPNPVKDFLNIETTETIDKILISNQLGQRIVEINKEGISGNSIDLSPLNKGIYLITVNANKKSQTLKIIKD
ncbi:T9SS type A sorting domain-containing protein [Flavivirga jejuensis]|uniref:T9SS type A sorting domain-containing protein n=1 Tax=Flavivirga jejuensis TaxID=870487 RepID=A0ABT8WIV2_9FLAO|nr:T9SS type A sorting domain-containing protein [Flavivirga jejuensis]MDO5973084.1 T9SS type A sorting domain-containing protein [Flavivirga jejuensis]